VTRAPSALELAGAAVRVGEPGYVDGRLHWLSTPPDGTGGSILYSGAPGTAPVAVSPSSIPVRSRLYQYGAGAWCATPLGLVGIESRTQQLGRLSSSAFTPLGATPGDADTLGDPVGVPGTSWILAVAEWGPGASSRGLVAIDVDCGERVVLAQVPGRCAEPQVAPDARAVAWIEWPDGAMPWDAAELRVAALDVTADAIALVASRRVDGGRGASVGSPTWRPDGSLAYVGEAAGWWQPWVCDDGGVVRRLSARRAEFQRPRWLTCRWLAPLGDDGALACAFADGDGEHVGVLDADGALHELDQPCVRVDGLAASSDALGWVGATTRGQGAVCAATWDASNGSSALRFVVEPAQPLGAPAPVPESFSFVAGDGDVDGVLWRPSSRTGAPVGPVPLVVSVHPGPTGAVDRSYAPIVHLLTAHGLAVGALDVSGSTAHGRAHRERLHGRFGELDVTECVAAARHLVEAGVADRGACFIRGTSAGGTIALLALEHATFLGAVAWYPASSFEDDEEGFEAGYLTTLVGSDVTTRSPLARAARLRGAVLVVQGADDPIVAPAATVALRDALEAAGVEVTYVEVEGEGHGFRTTVGRAQALDAELDFYLRHVSARRATPDGRGADRVADPVAVARYDARTGGPDPAAPRPS
jgi:dipeptidyl aminopeptidase/acylaminoacyl peptidase